jgi:hypothetical protein
MARGWESKSVEAQQADKDRDDKPESAPAIDPVKAARRRTLELARARAHADLKAARHPAHREMLERAIRDIEAQLARDAGGTS